MSETVDTSIIYHTQTIGDVAHKGHWDHGPAIPIYKRIPVKDCSVADVGCRDGLFCQLFADSGASRVVGMDVQYTASMKLVQECRSDIGFERQDIYDLFDRPRGEFDVVFCGDVIQHLDSPLLALKALRHLAKDAVYLVTDIPLGEENRCVMRENHIATYPYLWGAGFVTKMIEASGMCARIMQRFTLSGSRYPTRHVALWEAIDHSLGGAG